MTTEKVEIITMLRELAFIVESVAHLQGKEHELLPTADKARALILRLEGDILVGRQEEDKALKPIAQTTGFCFECGRKFDSNGYCPKCDSDVYED